METITRLIVISKVFSSYGDSVNFVEEYAK